MAFSTHIFEEIERQKLNNLEKTRQEILRHCIAELKKYFKTVQVKSLYITGSLITPYRFSTHSDIDIAAEGFPPDKYFLAIAELEEILSRKVEIIELENCRFAQKIIDTGLKII